MKVLIVYDSVYGNTEQIAQAIGHALGSQEDVEVLRVGDVKPEQLTGLKLLIVGSPTHGFRPTPTINSLLERIPMNGLGGVKVAAFDTRISMDDIDPPILRFAGRLVVGLFGYAAKPIADKLKVKGGELTIPPEGFFVEGTEGPLKEGELERATDWARQIMATQ
jgi:flavodoxin I